MLAVKNLTVCYNDFLALNDISLKIQEGTLTGIIGIQKINFSQA